MFTLKAYSTDGTLVNLPHKVPTFDIGSIIAAHLLVNYPVIELYRNGILIKTFKA